jgi:hypothetical protein
MLQIIIFVLTNMIQIAESNQSYQFYLVRWQCVKLLLVSRFQYLLIGYLIQAHLCNFDDNHEFKLFINDIFVGVSC